MVVLPFGIIKSNNKLNVVDFLVPGFRYTGSRPRRGRWAPAYALLVEYGQLLVTFTFSPYIKLLEVRNLLMKSIACVRSCSAQWRSASARTSDTLSTLRFRHSASSHITFSLSSAYYNRQNTMIKRYSDQSYNNTTADCAVAVLGFSFFLAGGTGWRHFHLGDTQLILSHWTTGYVIAYIKL